MKQLMTSRIRIVLIAALLLAVVLAVVSALTGLSLPDMAVKGVLTPVRTGAAKLTDKARELYGYIIVYWEDIRVKNSFALAKKLNK